MNDEYFEHAKKMCEKAKKEGFELSLVLLWCNYVPGTWASSLIPDGVLPFDCLKNYVEKVHETFSKFEPLYIVSRDTDFTTQESIKYYAYVASALKKLAPSCLLTTHIKGRYTYIPKEIYQYLDLCFYQSGHNAKDLSMPYSLSEEMQNKYPGKPLINSEPCYEEMGYSGQMYGRWTRFDVRRCAFMSILSGACAGITYGAAGIYSWHKVKKSFESSLGEGFDMPKSWEEAMSFTGAWDYGYIKAIFEELKVNSIIPKQDILINDTNDIRVAQANNGLIFVYVPYNTTIRLSINLDGWSIKAVDLAERFIANIKMIVKEKHTVIDMHPFSQDALLILKKENEEVCEDV